MLKPGFNENLLKAGHLFYGIGIAALGIMQFMYSDFRPVILPPSWPSWMHGSIQAYITGAALVIAGIFIATGKNARTASLYLGGFLFVFFLVFQVSFTLFIQPNSPRHLGLWTDPLKELALSGGAFVMAGSFFNQQRNNNNSVIILLEKLIPAGRIFFSIMMIAFGLDHFYYTQFVSSLVPSWIPGPVFWTYFAAVALIGSGIGIILKIKLQLIALLSGVMLFLWFIFLHIPRAVADPYMNKGNEITSVFQALLFSGTSFVIACIYKNKSSRV
jgi:uncharacterized membrane protein YphA (DoxX/SURF4 family)